MTAPARRFAFVRCLFLAVPVAGLWPAAAPAQGGYPARPVRFVVPFSPGGGGDILARPLAQKLGEAWRQQVIIDNRGGAGGSIGVEFGARSAPDGYTLVMGTAGTHGINASLYAKLPYDPAKDFAPVTMMAVVPNLLAAHPSVPARSVKELLDLARAKPGRLSFGSSGSGTTGHLAAELMKSLAGVSMVHVPYKGAAVAVTGLVGGETDFMFTNVSVLIGMVRAGRLRPIAVSGERRSALLPDVPTVAESGLPGFEANSWYAMFAPAGTPDAVVRQVNAEAVKALRSSDVASRYAAEGAEPAPGAPEELGRRVRDDIVKWARVVKASGARAD